VALDFPNAPTVGQTFTGPNGVVWTWDSVKWTAASTGDAYLPLTGGTLTGPLTLAADPTVPLGTATKQYADTKAPLASPALTGIPTVPTAAPGTATTQAASTAFVAAAVAPAFNNVGRNLLHNPLFNVQQRGAGQWSASGSYTADRWLLDMASDTSSAAISLANDAARAQIGDEACRYLIGVAAAGNAAAGAYTLLIQRIESLQRLSGKTVTISFWAGGSALKLGVSLDSTFGTGGSPSATVSGNGQAVNVTGTYTRFSLTFAVPSSAGMTFGTNGDDFLALNLWFSNGSNFTVRSGGVGVQTGSFYIWGVQLEVGTVATPLEKPDPQQDLARCQRFYQTLSSLMAQGYNVAGVNVYNAIPLPVVMRASPTVTQQAAGSAGNATLLAAFGATDHLQMAANITGTGYGYISANYQLSADL
jgi:hypothetical protein